MPLERHPLLWWLGWHKIGLFCNLAYLHLLFCLLHIIGLFFLGVKRFCIINNVRNCFRLIPESVRWLLAKDNNVKAKKIVVKVARMNKVILSESLLKTFHEDDGGGVSSYTYVKLFCKEIISQLIYGQISN